MLCLWLCFSEMELRWLTSLLTCLSFWPWLWNACPPHSLSASLALLSLLYLAVRGCLGRFVVGPWMSGWVDGPSHGPSLACSFGRRVGRWVGGSVGVTAVRPVCRPVVTSLAACGNPKQRTEEGASSGVNWSPLAFRLGLVV